MKIKMSAFFNGRCSVCKKDSNVFDVYDDERRKTEPVCLVCSAGMGIVKIKMSAAFKSKCDICGKEKNVVSFGDEDTRKVATICSECAGILHETNQKDLIEKYGKVNEEPFKQGVRIEGKSIGG